MLIPNFCVKTMISGDSVVYQVTNGKGQGGEHGRALDFRLYRFVLRVAVVDTAEFWYSDVNEPVLLGRAEKSKPSIEQKGPLEREHDAGR